MDPQAAKMIGAGIACIGMGGAGVGVGTIFGHYLAAALRNPSAAQGQFANLIFGFAVTEALAFSSLLIPLFLLSPLYLHPLPPPRHSAMAQQSAQPITEQIPASEHGRGFPPFDPHNFPSQLIWLALTFIALYLL